MIDISTYLNRITSEHKVQPKFMGLVAARLEPLIDIFELLEEIDKAFDLDTAEGSQLDTIGEYIGVKRLLDFQPEYADSVLTDPYYRMLLKARVSLNNWDGSIEGVKKIWGDVFPDYEIQVVDNQDMTMEARIIGLRSLFESELVKHGYISPKPMGVRVDYTVVMSIKLDTGLFLGAVNSYRTITTNAPGKSPPETISIPNEVITVGSMITEQQKSSFAESKAASEELNPPLIDDYSEAAIVSTIIKRSSIRVRS